MLLMMYSLSCASLFADESMESVRLNPLTEHTASGADIADMLPFVDASTNHIELNGADWSSLAAKFAAAKRGDSIFTVVYLGDSHVQADFAGAVVRERLAREAGSAGRGLVIPYKLSGTNEPRDYTITLDGKYTSARLISRSNDASVDVPFTGVGIKPIEAGTLLRVSCTEPFDLIKVISHNPEGCTAEIVDKGYKDLEHTVMLDDSVARTIGGLILQSGDSGTFVHSIGHNGATFSNYCGHEPLCGGLASLEPDLIIVALGTNDAFGKSSLTDIATDIDVLIKRLYQSCPFSEILLVTPTECYKKSYTRTKTKKGKRRRTATMVVNDKVRHVADEIRLHARQNGIALYDRYKIASGAGAAAKMKRHGVLGKDGVHFTVEGYRAWGNLVADALLEQLLTPLVRE